MHKNSRTYNTIRNTAFGVGGKLVTYVLTFVYRTVFIYTLGKTYLGVQGLFSNILSMLSLAELGIGSAITFSLYKPLAEKDTKRIQGLMNFYVKSYRIIGIVVAIAGLSITPFLDKFIKEKMNIPYLHLIYVLYLSDSVLSYFFAYKRSIIIADQKLYVESLNSSIFSLIRNALQICWMLLFKSFIPVLVIQSLCTFLSNVSISRKSEKLYPYLKASNNEKLNTESQKDLFKKIRAMISHKIGSVVVLGTDNLLISTFVGIEFVGMYSNYTMIISMILTFIQQFSQSLVSSIGNFVALESVDSAKKTLNQLFFVQYWIYSFCSICLFILFNPFITFWLGGDYTFNSWIVTLIVLNFYIGGMRQTVLAFRDSLGLYWYDRHKPILEAITNLIASILLLKYYGIAGIFLGSLISTVTTSLWIEPFVLFKYYFHNGLKGYFIKYVVYSIVTIAVSILMYAVSLFIFNGSILSLILLFLLCAIIPNAVMYGVYFKTPEFKECILRIRSIVRRL